MSDEENSVVGDDAGAATPEPIWEDEEEMIQRLVARELEARERLRIERERELQARIDRAVEQAIAARFGADQERINRARVEQNQTERCKTMKELFSPLTLNHSWCIALPDNGNFELRSNLIHHLPHFHGMTTEDPIKHLEEFVEVCQTMRNEGENEEALKLKAFLFSLKGRAKDWLLGLPARSIRTWIDLQEKFLDTYYPAARIRVMSRELDASTQKPNHSLVDLPILEPPPASTSDNELSAPSDQEDVALEPTLPTLNDLEDTIPSSKQVLEEEKGEEVLEQDEEVTGEALQVAPTTCNEDVKAESKEVISSKCSDTTMEQGIVLYTPSKLHVSYSLHLFQSQGYNHEQAHGEEKIRSILIKVTTQYPLVQACKQRRNQERTLDVLRVNWKSRKRTKSTIQSKETFSPFQHVQHRHSIFSWKAGRKLWGSVSTRAKKQSRVYWKMNRKKIRHTILEEGVPKFSHTKQRSHSTFVWKPGWNLWTSTPATIRKPVGAQWRKFDGAHPWAPNI